MATLLCACIDIGSNTTRLLVAQPSAEPSAPLIPVLQRRAFTRLCEGPVGAARIAEIAGAVAEHVRLARAVGAERVRAVATAAVRDAPEGPALCAAVSERAGVAVEVLSCDEEARLAFAGATRTLGAPPMGRLGVVDVGGGSTELVCGTAAEGVAWSTSLRIGSGVLAEACLRSDPPSARELSAVRERTAAAFADVACPRPGTAYAVGGSATSLSRLFGAELSADVLDRAVEMLGRLPAAEVARRFEVHRDRVRLLPAAVLLLAAAAAAFAVPLRMARGGLREGVVLEELDRAGAGR